MYLVPDIFVTMCIYCVCCIGCICRIVWYGGPQVINRSVGGSLVPRNGAWQDDWTSWWCMYMDGGRRRPTREGKKRRRVSWREDEEGSEGVYGRVLSVQDDDIR